LLQHGFLIRLLESKLTSSIQDQAGNEQHHQKASNYNASATLIVAQLLSGESNVRIGRHDGLGLVVRRIEVTPQILAGETVMAACAGAVVPLHCMMVMMSIEIWLWQLLTINYLIVQIIQFLFVVYETIFNGNRRR